MRLMYIFGFTSQTETEAVRRGYTSVSFFMCAPTENASFGLDVYVCPVAGAE